MINEDSFFLSHRTRIAEKAIAAGWRVLLVAKDTGRRREVEKLGVEFIDLPVVPTGMNLREELKTLRFLLNLYRRHPDAIVHHVGLKNMLWGGLASRLSGSRGVVYAVSGLGHLFGEEKKRLAALIQRGLKFAMHRPNVAVIFQNHDDESLFVDNGLISKDKTYFIKGSGVDLKEFTYSPLPQSAPYVVIFTGRMLKEKGVTDFVRAARILEPSWQGKVEFWLCGGLSSNPSAMTEQEMLDLADGEYVKWLGYRSDIPQLLQRSSIVCYPSYYREGVPKSLIEATASGRPIVTTDSVGCRDTVDPGINGLLVSTHSPEDVARAIERLLSDRELMVKMGKRSREKAEREFDVDSVAARHLEIYERLMESRSR